MIAGDGNKGFIRPVKQGRHIITAAVRKSGLDKEETHNAKLDGRYLSRLDEARRGGQLLSLTGVPMFIVENKYTIVGAQPIEIFRNLLDKAK